MSKKRSAKAIRKCIRQQLQFIRRDIGYIADFVRNKDIRLTETGKPSPGARSAAFSSPDLP